MSEPGVLFSGMPYQLHINKPRRLCFVVLYGRVDGDQLVEAVNAIIKHPDWQAGYDTLWDGTSIEETVFELGKVRKVRKAVDVLAQYIGPGKSAYVATRQVAYLAAWLFRAILHIPGREIRVFSSLDEARAWLGLASSPTQALTDSPPESY